MAEDLDPEGGDPVTGATDGGPVAPLPELVRTDAYLAASTRDERVEPEAPRSQARRVRHRPPTLRDACTAPQDPLIPPGRLAAPAEGHDRDPPPIAPQQPAALEFGPAPMGTPAATTAR